MNHKLLSYKIPKSEDYKTLYYPAADIHFSSLNFILERFPNITTALFIDKHSYPQFFEKDISDRFYKKINEKNINKVLTKNNLSLISLKYQNKPYDFLNKQNSQKSDKQVDILMLHQDYKTFHLNDHTTNPTIHLINTGNYSPLAMYKSFYPKIISDMKINDILFLRLGEFPLYSDNYGDIGLSYVYGEDKRKRINPEEPNFKKAINNTHIWKKTQHLDFQTIQDYWLHDHR
jgi:hypothetical protein